MAHGSAAVKGVRGRIMLRITLESVEFYSFLDEELFFGWLKSIPAYQRCDGVGRSLVVEFDEGLVCEEMVRELLALFLRYEHALAPLAIFSNFKGGEFLLDKGGPWFSQVFEG